MEKNLSGSGNQILDINYFLIAFITVLTLGVCAFLGYQYSTRKSLITNEYIVTPMPTPSPIFEAILPRVSSAPSPTPTPLPSPLTRPTLLPTGSPIASPEQIEVESEDADLLDLQMDLQKL